MPASLPPHSGARAARARPAHAQLRLGQPGQARAAGRVERAELHLQGCACALHVHCMCTACALHVHCMCTACALRVHCVCIPRRARSHVQLPARRHGQVHSERRAVGPGPCNVPRHPLLQAGAPQPTHRARQPAPQPAPRTTHGSLSRAAHLCAGLARAMRYAYTLLIHTRTSYISPLRRARTASSPPSSAR